MRLTNPWGAAAALAVCALAGCGESRDVVGFTGAQSSCASCHTAPDEGAPFRDTSGATEEGDREVGAHNRHIAPVAVSSPMPCSECHVVPRSVADPEHINGVATLTFGRLARTGGINPTGCGTTYCHGNFRGGNAPNTPVWIAPRSPEAACGTCHDLPPPTGRHQVHVVDQGIGCNACHVFQTATHVNGTPNLVFPFTRPDPAFPGTCAQVCHHNVAAWFD